MASVSEVSGDWAGTFVITSESDSEAGSWGNKSWNWGGYSAMEYITVSPVR